MNRDECLPCGIAGKVAAVQQRQLFGNAFGEQVGTGFVGPQLVLRVGATTPSRHCADTHAVANPRGHQEVGETLGECFAGDVGIVR